MSGYLVTITLLLFYFSLDELLDGGLYTGELTEIVGAAGVGKSQVMFNTEPDTCP